ncbi:MAG: DegT/DnrJ/EryC1/StrS family aminotransferase [Caldilineaceae bacterium]
MNHPVPFNDLRAQYRALQADIGAATARAGQRLVHPGQGSGRVRDRVRRLLWDGGLRGRQLGHGRAAPGPARLRHRAGRRGDHRGAHRGGHGGRHPHGATPVLVDIGADSFTMDPAAAAAAVTPRTKAIVPVHLYGQPAALDEIWRLRIAKSAYH